MLAPERWLKRGWRTFVLNAGAFVGATLLLVIGAALSIGLLAIPLGMGLLEMALQARRGEEVGAWEVTRGFRFFGPGLLLWLVGIGACMTVGACRHVPLVGALAGFIAWLVWAFIHLLYLVTFQSRILVFIQWGIQNLTFSRGARLITGAAPTDFNFSKELSEINPEPVNAPR